MLYFIAQIFVSVAFLQSILQQMSYYMGQEFHRRDRRRSHEPLHAREMGEVEYSYIQSLTTLKQDWSYRNTEAGLASSVAQLNAWGQALDDEMKATVSALSDEDLAKTIERGSQGGAFPAPIEMQLDIYLQALLIFFGKVAIYLKAMNKPLPEDIQACIG